MSFLSVLKNGARVLWNCINHQCVVGKKVVGVSNSCNLKISHRTFLDGNKILPKPSSHKIIKYLKSRDRISDNFELIYRVRDTFAFHVCHTAIAITTLTIPTSLLLIAHKHGYNFPVHITESFSIGTINDVYFFVGFSYSILMFAFLLVKRFPLRIYRRSKGDDYIVCFSNLALPWSTYQVRFKKGEVALLLESKRIPFQITNYTINGSKVIFIEDYFSRPFELEYMIGSSLGLEQDKEDKPN